MKLKKFFEYTDNIKNEKFIDLNNNEIKYLRDKGNLIIQELRGETYYYLNYLGIKKLITGEFFVIYQKVKCSTIQSLLKYTEKIIKPLVDTLDNLILNSEKSDINQITDKITYKYNDYLDLNKSNEFVEIETPIWATINMSTSIISIDYEYWNYILYKGSLANYEMELLIRDKFQKELNDYRNWKIYM